MSSVVGNEKNELECVGCCWRDEIVAERNLQGSHDWIDVAAGSLGSTLLRLRLARAARLGFDRIGRRWPQWPVGVYHLAGCPGR
jgi:hypothetical protein